VISPGFKVTVFKVVFVLFHDDQQGFKQAYNHNKQATNP